MTPPLAALAALAILPSTLLPRVLEEPRLAIGALWNGYIVLVHATVFLAGAALTLPLLRRASPAIRAAAYAALPLGALAVTVLCWLPSGWWAWLLPSSVSAPLVWLGASSVAAWESPGSPDVRPIAALYLLWLAGGSVVLARTLVGWWTMHALVRRAAPLAASRWQHTLHDAGARVGLPAVVLRLVRLRASGEVAVPLTWGIIAPVIILPADASEWSDTELRLVLLHELSHVRRADVAVQLVAQLAVAWYWFHPGIHWALRGWQRAREEACDARVLAAGARRSDYAACLLRMADRAAARHSSGRRPSAAPAMTRGRRHLAHRVRQLLASTTPTPTPIPTPTPTPSPAARLRRQALGALALAACAGWAWVMGTVRLAPQRRVVWTALAADDWATRAYAAHLFSGTRSPAIRAELRARAGRDPHPAVRRIVARVR
jgi:beta-lactamase regulating signal transducer with metallopeptidase domain